MPVLAEQLRGALDLEVDVRVAEGAELPLAPAPDEADLLVLFLRRREASDAARAALDAWFEADKPAIALRTTSHAIEGDMGWFPPRFGGHYMGHVGNRFGVRVAAAGGAAGHPLLRGVPREMDFQRGGLYFAQPLADGAEPLLFGRTIDRSPEPVAWTFGRNVYTSLGTVEQLGHDGLRTFLANAVLWCLGRDVPPGGALGGRAHAAARGPRTLPPPPALDAPEDATVLFGGALLDAWRHWDASVEPPAIEVDSARHALPSLGDAPRWSVEDGALVARSGFGDLVTREAFGDYHLHLDFLVPNEEPGSVFLSGRYGIPFGGDPGRWHSLDLVYEHVAGEPAHVKQWIDGVGPSEAVVSEPSLGAFLAPLWESKETAGAKPRFVADDEVSAACDFGAESWAVTARFRTTNGGTLVSKCPPEGKWVPDAKALFLRGGRLVYDIGWVGALTSKRRFDDGEWHRVVLTSDGGVARLWVGGELEAERADFRADDRDGFVLKVGAANVDFAGTLQGEVARVRFWKDGLSEEQARTLSRGDMPSDEPSFRWDPSEEASDALYPSFREGEAVRGPIRLVAGSSAARFANVWVRPLEEVDHAGMIASWGPESLARGRATYEGLCVTCHGFDGLKTTNPNARPFASGELLNGSDPRSLFATVTDGWQDMPGNAFLSPRQRYDVIHYVRETYLREQNPTQYFDVTREYLASLPKGKREREATGELAPRDQGPALASQLGDDVGAHLAVRLGDDTTIGYDLQTMESTGVWTGGFLELSTTQHYQQRGEGRAQRGGELLPGLEAFGWGHGGTLDWDRARRPERGPLPREWLDYRGHYVDRDGVVLSYAIDGRGVLERPGRLVGTGLPVITHRLRIEPGEQELVLSLGGFECDPRITAESSGSAGAVIGSGERFVVGASVGGDLMGTVTRGGRERLVARIPAASEPLELFLLRAACRTDDELAAMEAIAVAAWDRGLPPSPLLATRGGPSRWPEVLVTRGELGDERPYALDTLTLPESNPWNAWLRTSALDFFPDGRAVVSTYGGDVWIVDGIDGELAELRWRRFAAGLFEPMGVRVVDGEIYVTCRDRITRLHDLNGDGEADFYESFFADPDVSPNFHAFNFDLQTDAAGNFYYAKSGQYTDFALPGAILKVAPDGGSYEVHCTGLRTPNGMGMSPDGRPLVSDNQGNWIPASKVSLTKPGGFYGVFPAIRTNGPGEQTRETFDLPVIWMPQSFDSSSGGQLWVEDERFGPLAGRYLHTSFGKGWMYPLVVDEVGDAEQAAIWRLPFQFAAGVQRLRVNPADGQVYAVGLSGWQGPAGGADGCLQRVRWTGEPGTMLLSARTVARGVELVFNGPLDARSADPGRLRVTRWNYRWARSYGSAHWSVARPDEKGEDEVGVSAAHLSADGQTLFVELEEVVPADSMRLELDVVGADGSELRHDVYFTVHQVPDA